MGMDINVHDQWAVESPGAVTDRSRENLAGTDVAISRYRAMLLRSMDKAASTETNAELPLHRAEGTPAIGPEWHDSIMDAGCPREEWLDGYRACRDKAGW